MVCLITGSSRGLGRAVALAYGRRGDTVAVHYNEDRAAAEEVVSQIGGSYAFKADVRCREEVDELVERVIGKWGRIDVLVNNAGITKEKLLLKTTEVEFEKVVDTNLKGPFNFIRAAGKYMTKQKSGHIVNISSYAGVKGKAGLSAYSASKAGLIGLTKTAAVEFAACNILANAVLPGYMLAGMGGASSLKGKDMALEEGVLKRYSNPEAVAEFICSLTDMKDITGQVINLDSRII